MPRSGLMALAAVGLATAGWAQDIGAPEDTQEGLPPFAPPAWLSDTVTRPHANIATTAAVPEITVEPLGRVHLDEVGLLPPEITGLPPGFWGPSSAEGLARLFRSQPVDALPEMQRLTQLLALAELDLPRGASAPEGTLFLARLDMLLARGALDPAQALMERAGPSDPAVFRRWFDVSLITGHGTRACAALAANPDLAPTFQARIFCLARSGDWPAAALSLGTAEALGRISPQEAAVIARFLDPELFEGEPPLPPDPDLTPLEFQMRVAIAERPDPAGLPLPFVFADLEPMAGWRAQLDAAERLTRAGAIAPQRWVAIYTAQSPAASGAIWDRVAALQAFDAALLGGDLAEAGARLGPAWAAMRAAGLEVAFAEIYAERLLRLPLTGEAGVLARRISLLSPLYETVAQSAVAQTPAETFAFAIAQGQTAPAPRGDRIASAVSAAFALPVPAHRYQPLVDQGRLGEAVLRAARVIGVGAEADVDDLTDALALLRGLGLEDSARRAALQLLILER